MPTSKSLAYDNEAYRCPVIFANPTVVGVSGTTPKYTAFTALQLRGVVMKPTIATTAAGSQPLLFTISGTTTSTSTLTVLTSGGTAPIANVLSTAMSCIQGDTFYVTHGTDAVVVSGCAIEAYVTPGAAVLAP